jgi:hypothetical protein
MPEQDWTFYCDFSGFETTSVFSDSVTQQLVWFDDSRVRRGTPRLPYKTLFTPGVSKSDNVGATFESCGRARCIAVVESVRLRETTPRAVPTHQRLCPACLCGLGVPGVGAQSF